MNNEKSIPNFLQPLNQGDFISKPVVIRGAERAGVLVSPQPAEGDVPTTQPTAEDRIDPLTVGLTPL